MLMKPSEYPEQIWHTGTPMNMYPATKSTDMIMAMIIRPLERTPSYGRIHLFQQLPGLGSITLRNHACR